jgi:hypothetical protein
MSLTLKIGAKYADPRNGNLINIPYGVVTRSEGNKRIRQQFITIEVFRDNRAFVQGAKPLETRVYGVEGEEFDKFFSPTALVKQGSDIYSISEDYLLQLNTIAANPFEDGQVPPLEWGDLWEKLE